MIVLTRTGTQQILANTAGVHVTNKPTCFCSYRIRTAATFEPENKFIEVPTAGTDIVCPQPASTGVSHIVDSIVCHNKDTITHTVTIQWTDGSNFSILRKETLLSGETLEYAEGFGWHKISPLNVPILNNRYILSGALYETFDRNLCDEVNTSLLSTGRLSLQAIYIPAGTTISSITFWSATTAAGTPTNQLFGLFDSSLNRLISSINDTTTAWAANSRKTLSLTSTFTTTYSGIYYLGIMVTATTVPTIKGNTAKTNGALNAGTPSMGGTSNTGLTTSLPATANAPAAVTTSFWGCVN